MNLEIVGIYMLSKPYGLIKLSNDDFNFTKWCSLCVYYGKVF